MSRSFRSVLTVLVLSLCLPGRGRTQDYNMDLSLKGIFLGPRVLGPEVKAEQLKHRVVLIEMWATTCKPCLESLPRLAAWNAEMRPLGLVMIGACSGNPVEVQSTALNRGVNFTTVLGVGLKGSEDSRAVPHCILFDHTGKCIYRGHPGRVELLLRKAVAEAPALVLEGKQLTKLVALNNSLRNEKLFGAVLKKAKGYTKAKDEETAEEATFVVEKLTAFGQKMLSEAREKKELEPLTTQSLASRVSTNFAGTEVGTEATTLVNELKKDAKFQADVQAWRNLQKVRYWHGVLRTPVGVKSPTDEKYRKLNAGALQQITDLVKHMQKNAPESKATEAARQLAERLALKLD